MKIAIVNKAGANSGGAGKMAVLLSEWLQDAGHEVVMFLAEHGGPPGSVVVRDRRIRTAKSIEVRTLMNDVVPVEYPLLKRSIQSFSPDVVHVHDISRAYSVDSIRLLSHDYPTVWTCHDRSPTTGGCISPLDCDRYNTGCGSCPQFGSWLLQGRYDLTHYAWGRRRALQRENKISMAAPSEWAADHLSRTPVIGQRRVTPIHNAIDPSQISLLPVAAARRKLGIDPDRFVILNISHDLNDLAKNPPSLRAALKSVSDLNPLLLTIGNSSATGEAAWMPLEVRSLGFLSDARVRRLAYGAADIFVNGSLSDTFSLTTLESLACGTPVVAYASGGIPEIVDDGSGILVEPDNAAALAESIRQVAAAGVDEAWRERARQRARWFSPSRHVSEYVALYEQTIQEAVGNR